MILTHSTTYEKVFDVLKNGIQSSHESKTKPKYEISNPKQIYFYANNSFPPELVWWGGYTFSLNSDWVKENHNQFFGMYEQDTYETQKQKEFEQFLFDTGIMTLRPFWQEDICGYQVISKESIPICALDKLVISTEKHIRRNSTEEKINSVIEKVPNHIQIYVDGKIK